MIRRRTRESTRVTRDSEARDSCDSDTHHSADAAPGSSPLRSKEFDLCDRGSAALRDWSHFECDSHLGPCCGDGVCQVNEGETPQRCSGDCD